MGNYSDQFWSNKIPVSLCEGPKPLNSMMSGCLNSGEPLFMDLNIPNDFKKYKEYGTVFEKQFDKYPDFGIPKVRKLDHIWKTRAPKTMTNRATKSSTS